MEKEKAVNVPSRDYGVRTMEALTDAVADHEHKTSGINLSYSLFFDGKNFTDTHSNIILARLYGVSCPLTLGFWTQETKKQRRYGLIVQDKGSHPKSEMGSCHHHERIYDYMVDVAQECIMDVAAKHGDACRAVEKWDADDFSKPKYDKHRRTNTSDMANPDLNYFIERQAEIMLPSEREWEKPRKRVKYLFKDISDLLRKLNQLEVMCKILQTPIPKKFRVPEDIIARVSQKILAGDSLSVQQGRADVAMYSDDVRLKINCLNTITDYDLLMKDTEVLY